ncbi:MAG: hypothetical protein RLZZ127_1619 [Planctomycetota bacterium]|jgi:hypothetical protein
MTEESAADSEAASLRELRRRARELLERCPIEGGNPEACQLHRHRFWSAGDKEAWLASLPAWLLHQLVRSHNHCMTMLPHHPPLGDRP